MVNIIIFLPIILLLEGRDYIIHMFGSVCMNHGEPHLFCKSYTLEQVILTSQLFSEKECFKDLMLNHIQDSSLLFVH